MTATATAYNGKLLTYCKQRATDCWLDLLKLDCLEQTATCFCCDCVLSTNWLTVVTVDLDLLRDVLQTCACLTTGLYYSDACALAFYNLERCVLQQLNCTTRDKQQRGTGWQRATVSTACGNGEL